MTINKSQKRIIFDHSKAAGHPDPEGFLARIDFESNYNEDKIGDDGRVGLSQVDPKEAEKYGIESVITIDDNTNAAIVIDLTNFKNNNNDLSKTYALWRGLTGKKAEDYNKSIDAKRKNVQDELFQGSEEEKKSDNELSYSSKKIVDGNQLKNIFESSNKGPLFKDPTTELIITIMELIDRV